MGSVSYKLISKEHCHESCIQLHLTDSMRQRQRHYSLHTYFFGCVQSLTAFGIATCSDWWRDFLEVAKHCDFICTIYRSLTLILQYLSVPNALFGWTVHDLLFKYFPRGWQPIKQGDIDVPGVCLYWCREWNLHHWFLFDLYLIYDEGCRCNDKLIIQKFDRHHLCMKTANYFACNWTQLFFVTWQVIGYVASCLSLLACHV